MVAWDECDAYARHVDDNGRETVTCCDLGRHAPPGDTTEMHHDPRLAIWWKYDGEGDYGEEEPEGHGISTDGQ